MKIVSVNVGLPREVVWKGTSVQTAIFKEPLAGVIVIGEVNLAVTSRRTSEYMVDQRRPSTLIRPSITTTSGSCCQIYRCPGADLVRTSQPWD